MSLLISSKKLVAGVQAIQEPVFNQENQLVWREYIGRQIGLIKKYACSEIIDCIKAIGFSPDRIPNYNETNRKLFEISGWQMTLVKGLVPFPEYIHLLANKTFPVPTFIRKIQDLAYTPEPDICHDLFAHLILLCNQYLADFLFEMGRTAQVVSRKSVTALGRLSWFTLEFGVVGHGIETKAYGAGLISSPGEILKPSSPEARIIPFSIEEVIKTPVKSDIMQSRYFKLSSLEQLEECRKYFHYLRMK
ncbi:MAG: phenylalanine 4-monooxygenase [Planctomycetes bacterium]|nr:phenylalanine 4-monooxygenase [Planctomycetota bacterium]